MVILALALDTNERGAPILTRIMKMLSEKLGCQQRDVEELEYLCQITKITVPADQPPEFSGLSQTKFSLITWRDQRVRIDGRNSKLLGELLSSWLGIEPQPQRGAIKQDPSKRGLSSLSSQTPLPAAKREPNQSRQETIEQYLTKQVTTGVKTEVQLMKVSTDEDKVMTTTTLLFDVVYTGSALPATVVKQLEEAQDGTQIYQTLLPSQELVMVANQTSQMQCLPPLTGKQQFLMYLEAAPPPRWEEHLPAQQQERVFEIVSRGAAGPEGTVQITRMLPTNVPAFVQYLNSNATSYIVALWFEAMQKLTKCQADDHATGVPLPELLAAVYDGDISFMIEGIPTYSHSAAKELTKAAARTEHQGIIQIGINVKGKGGAGSRGSRSPRGATTGANSVRGKLAALQKKTKPSDAAQAAKPLYSKHKGTKTNDGKEARRGPSTEQRAFDGSQALAAQMMMVHVHDAQLLAEIAATEKAWKEIEGEKPGLGGLLAELITGRAVELLTEAAQERDLLSQTEQEELDTAMQLLTPPMLVTLQPGVNVPIRYPEAVQSVFPATRDVTTGEYIPFKMHLKQSPHANVLRGILEEFPAHLVPEVEATGDVMKCWPTLSFDSCFARKPQK